MTVSSSQNVITNSLKQSIKCGKKNRDQPISPQFGDTIESCGPPKPSLSSPQYFTKQG